MKFPALRLLVQAYLSLDWPEDYKDSWAAVDEFIAQEHLARTLPDEITELMGSIPNQNDLRSFLMVDLGCGYVPESDGLTAREWLMALSERALLANE